MTQDIQGHAQRVVPLVLLAVCQLEARPLAFLACSRRGRDKKQSNVVISMDRFSLVHQVLLYVCYVKCKSARNCSRKFRRKLQDI